MEPVNPPLRIQGLIETQALRIAVLEAEIAGCQALLLALNEARHLQHRRLAHRDRRRRGPRVLDLIRETAPADAAGVDTGERLSARAK